MNWKAIEKLVLEPIWVLKYDMWSKDGKFVPAGTDGATKHTDCHGWYATQEDALKVRAHFPNPSAYRPEKVWKRELL